MFLGCSLERAAPLHPRVTWLDSTRRPSTGGGAGIRRAGELLEVATGAPLRELGRRRESHIVYVASAAKGVHGLSALPVQPGGMVAWAASRWFGMGA
jgi:hypothetical protein